MTPIDPRAYCPQHSLLTQQVGTLLVETGKQTSKLEAIHSDVKTHLTEHATEEKVKARWKWIVPVLVAVALALLGAVFSAGKLITTGPDAKEIAAAVVAAQKGQP
jgi:cytochrome c-type biogenesis protein CcmH/NrfG